MVAQITSSTSSGRVPVFFSNPFTALAPMSEVAPSFNPLSYYRKSNSLQSIMIEVRRDLYMDESTGDKSPLFDQMRARLRSVLNRLVDVYRCTDI